MSKFTRIILPLFLGAAASVGAASHADAQSKAPAVSKSSYWDIEMDRRRRMIDALEVSKDDAKLSEIVKEDVNLDTYYTILRRETNYVKSQELVEKLLNLPVIDQGSEAYADVVRNLYAENIANDSKAPPEINALLYAKIKNDPSAKTRALRFIFSTATMNMPRLPNEEQTKQLVRDGANVDEAYTQARSEIPQNDVHAQYKLERLDKFKASVTAP